MAIEYRRYLLRKIARETENVRTFTLAPEEGEVPSFRDGQFFNIRVPKALGVIKPNFRSYSVLAPHSPDRISFGIKLEGAFTHLLFDMKEGDGVELAGPFGSFVMKEPADAQDADRPADEAPVRGQTDAASRQSVFLAGGIGITPLHCMAAGFVQKKKNGKAILFYSNREEDNIAYRGSLDALHGACPDFEAVYTLTGESAPAGWTGERGRIGPGMLALHGVDFTRAHFYLCGSPPFVKGLIAMLTEAGVEAQRVHKEQW